MQKKFPVKAALVTFGLIFVLGLAALYVLLFAMPVNKAELQNSFARLVQAQDPFAFSTRFSLQAPSGSVSQSRFNLIYSQSTGDIYLEQIDAENAAPGMPEEKQRTLLWGGQLYSAAGDDALRPAQTEISADQLLTPLQTAQQQWQTLIPALSFSKSFSGMANGAANIQFTYTAPLAAADLQPLLDELSLPEGLTAESGRLEASLVRRHLFGEETLSSAKITLTARTAQGETVNAVIVLYAPYPTFDHSVNSILQQQISQVQ